MTSNRTLVLRGTTTLLLLGSALAFAPAWAAPAKDLSDARLRYEQERAVCMSGRSNQDRVTCLQEAGAAWAEARKGGLRDDATQYTRNATQRCDALPQDDRRDCLARMQGDGTLRGSAKAGGIYRELVTVTREQAVVPPAQDPPASAPK